MLSRKNVVRLLLPSTALILLIVLAACDTGAPQSTFGPEGPVAQKQLGLFKLIFWLAVVVFIIVEGMLLFMIIRFRRKPGQDGLPPQTHGNTRLEIAWTIVPALILVAIAIPTYITIADQRQPPKDQEGLKVEVVAHQWWWEFRYPDLGVVTANELHVPVDTAVNVTLHSDDVIHSFWIPKLAGKVDVVPRHSNKLWFVATKPAMYLGQCAEFCGIAHANMRLRVISQEKADFQTWVDGQKAPPTRPTDELAVKGSQLFGAKGCLVCHTASGPDADGVQQSRMKGFLEGSSLFPAPNLTSFATRTTFAGGIIENTPEHLRRWVRNPDDVKPGNHMGALAAAYQDKNQRLSPAEVDALVAYLRTLTPDLTAPRATPTPPPPTEATATPAPPTGATPAPPPPSGALQIATVGNDLKFDTDRLAAPRGSVVRLTLKNNATSKALQHNWVLVKAGTEDAVATAGLAAGPANNWVPKANPNVIATTKLVDGAASGQISFQAPAPGAYAFICSFPGHAPTMRGVFEVR